MAVLEGEGVEDGAEDVERFGAEGGEGVEGVDETRGRFDVVGGYSAGG